MSKLLDTKIAILLRDGDPQITAAVARIGDGVFLSIVTQVELEGGVYRDPVQAAVRRSNST